MAEGLQVGNVVKLNSGGPNMTVMEVFSAASKREEIHEKVPVERVQCSWTLQIGQMASDTFPSACVTVVSVEERAQAK